MNTTKLIGLVVTLLVANSAVHAAGYMKLGDIKGEVAASQAPAKAASKPATPAAPAADKVAAPPNTGASSALLLPAVQKVREAAAR